MGSTLKQNLSDSYYQRRNLLTSTPDRVSVLVEDSSDISIWTRILEKACPGKRFNVKPYQYGDNKSQSKPLVIQTIIDNGGPLYIGCVDSDLDVFLEPYRYPKGLFYPAHFLFHTYVYSIESLFCLPSTLGALFTTATSFPCRFNFVLFFRQLSQIIYPLFVTDLYLRSKGYNKKVFNVEDWKYVLPSKKIIKQSLAGKQDEVFVSAQKGVKKYINSLQKHSSYDDDEYNAYQQQLTILFSYLTPDNCMSFIYGHGLFDFVVDLMEGIREKEVSEAKEQIRLDKTLQQHVKDQKIRQLDNLQMDIATMLHANFEFLHNNSLPYQMIEKDIKASNI